MARLIMALCAIASVGGCTTRAAQSCAPGVGSPVAVFTVFLGRAIPERNGLTDKEWQSFLDDTVTANLPNGYTVFDADGGWMNPITRKTIREHTKVLLVALPEVPASLAAINRIRSAYQSQFRQQVVGMTVAPGCGTF
jgi:uncharacterized protein DUF3574